MANPESEKGCPKARSQPDLMVIVSLQVKGRCGICKKGLEDDEDGIGICAVSILKCNHVFHSGCIDDDTGCEMRCPTCGCGGLGESEGCGVGLKRRRKEVGQLKAAKKRKEEDFGES
eukprot:TRINITY_DN2477_c0_g1_i1.p3 TRINITY_DN2477_c0_g1~~TRINITY_DN2477_c0_g1_i1.p3  ORF type:complete len:117 (-),score=14.65 TRINITY_DN2477_c0_g1_i1:19-369(-)